MKTWFGRFITSSIGQKLVMSLTGLFLITFLIVHLAGNVQLMWSDGGQAFNEYAYFMTHNPLIKFTSYGLYFFILLHAFQGIALWMKNKKARGSEGYAVKVNRTAGASKASYRMGALGIIILVFILLHMYQFWLQMKLGNTEMVAYGGEPVKDLYTLVAAVYENPVFVGIYVVSMLVIAFHLWHGFESAFQTLGLNHRKYTPLIKTVGRIYSVAVPLGFAVIPVYMYLFA
ncbi:succinate dehydrogenase cytochrome b subunit [Lewinella sp. W8]|uniref:succinate dehydrogenase cytochrome b subunit n=1 Tax=Lewinella sp. W8 TaxID=2528208 RepID=UPI0010688B1B|nr:succinate dehydrogenase cytochrome b subunit [Lewinella sp. W8]MTB53773.1 succinate dehydrogenase [Lewinella sp. W8]